VIVRAGLSGGGWSLDQRIRELAAWYLATGAWGEWTDFGIVNTRCIFLSLMVKRDVYILCGRGEREEVREVRESHFPDEFSAGSGMNPRSTRNFAT
jgi:hypothetical protein